MQPDGPRRDAFHRPQVVADEQDGRAGTRQGVDAVVAAGAKRLVAHGEHLVDEEHARVGVDGDGEAEAGVHARAEVLHGRVQCASPSPANAAISSMADAQASAAARPRIEPCSITFSRPVSSGWNPAPDLDQRGEPPADLDAAAVRRRDPGHDLEEGRLARAVLADDGQRLAGGHREADAVERANHLPRVVPSGQEVAQGAVGRAAAPVGLGEVLHHEQGRHQTTSAKRRSARRKTTHETTRRPTATAEPMDVRRASGAWPSSRAARAPSTTAVSGLRAKAPRHRSGTAVRG